jgi:competence protein ComEA
MGLFEKFNQAFGFTSTERRVVMLLVVALIAGMGIKLYKSAGGTTPRYDYSSSDSEFAARSRLIAEHDSNSSIRPTHDAFDNSHPASGPVHAVDKVTHSVININTATKEELVKLPGIGEAMAERIIMYREENGPFRSVEDLTNVKGIGKKKLAQIAPFCSVGK